MSLSIRGGGKRGAKSDVSGTGNTKEERISSTKETLNAVHLRVQTKSGASPAIHKTALAFNEVVKGSDSNPNNVITALIKDYDKTKMMKLIKALGSRCLERPMGYCVDIQESVAFAEEEPPKTRDSRLWGVIAFYVEGPDIIICGRAAGPVPREQTVFRAETQALAYLVGKTEAELDVTQAQIAELRMLLARSGTTPRGDSSPRSARRAEVQTAPPRTSLSPGKSRNGGSAPWASVTSVGPAKERPRDGEGLASCAAQCRGQAAAGPPPPSPALQRAQVLAEALVVATPKLACGVPTRSPAGLLASPRQDGRQAMLTPRLSPSVSMAQEVSHAADFPALLSPAYGSRSIITQAACATPQVPLASPSGSFLLPTHAALVPSGSLNVAPAFEKRAPSPCGRVSG
ncbi:unnamed protein product, partial [Symbiodinium sp. CCMP2592]